MSNSINGIIFLASLILLIGCDKNNGSPSLSFEEQLEVDLGIINDYLTTNGLTAQETASGLHYFITEEGPGDHPLPTEVVEVKYRGYLPTGEVFDATASAETATFPLNGVIPGWIEGVQLLKSGGGSGTLLIPSYLGYGTRGSGSIPANQVLIFDITLIDIK